MNAPPAAVRYATWQSLTDVTGDGRPDLVFAKNGKLWVARNHPGAGGSTTLGAGQAVAQLSDSTFANGAFETRTATNNRFTYGADHRNIDEVWRQAIDVNGDGRIDIIDAAEEADRWVVYLNTPGAAPSCVKWERRSYSISRLHLHLQQRGHLLPPAHLPLARRFTGRDRVVGACWISNGPLNDPPWSPYPAGWSNGSCGSVPEPAALHRSRGDVHRVGGDRRQRRRVPRRRLQLVTGRSRVDGTAVVHGFRRREGQHAAGVQSAAPPGRRQQRGCRPQCARHADRRGASTRSPRP